MGSILTLILTAMFLLASIAAPSHAHIQSAQSENMSIELVKLKSSSLSSSYKSVSSDPKDSHNGSHKNCEDCGNCHHSFVGLLVQYLNANVLPSSLPAPCIQAAIPHPHIDAFVRPPRA